LVLRREKRKKKSLSAHLRKIKKTPADVGHGESLKISYKSIGKKARNKAAGDGRVGVLYVCVSRGMIKGDTSSSNSGGANEKAYIVNATPPVMGE